MKQHPCCCHQKPLYFQLSFPKLPAIICRSARPMCIDVQMLIWAVLQRTHSSVGKLRVAAQRPWSPSRMPTHPSYFFRSASVFKWSLAWFARSVTIETKEKKPLLTGQWQRGWAEGEKHHYVHLAVKLHFSAGLMETINQPHQMMKLKSRWKTIPGTFHYRFFTISTDVKP